MSIRLLRYNERIFARYIRGNGIEIGALNHPMVVPRDVKVRYIDHLDTDGLRRHYPELAGVEIVDVDVVASVDTLDSVFPPGSLDFVVANQVIEHFDDPLGAFMQFHRVLRVGGIVHLAVPDKRATFDRDRPRTPLSHLIADHEEPKGPRKEARDSQHYREWSEKVPQYIPEPQRDYNSNLEQLWADRYSIHLHVWEPDDWPTIINYLNQNAYPYRLLDYSNVLSPGDRNEFVLILRKEEVALPPLPTILSEKGPFYWYIVRFLRRVPFLRTLKHFVESIGATD